MATLELNTLLLNVAAYPSENSFVFIGAIVAQLNWLEVPSTTSFNFIINDGERLEHVNNIIIDWKYLELSNLIYVID